MAVGASSEPIVRLVCRMGRRLCSSALPLA
jgi:hypothetical protein